MLCPEGERDCDDLARHGLPAFTFGGTADLPAGCEELVAGRDVVILADNDEAGRKHAEAKAALFARTAQSRARRIFSRRCRKRAMSAIGSGTTAARSNSCGSDRAGPTWKPSGGEDADDDPGEKEAADDTLYSLGDFTAFLPTHTYLFKPTRDLWPAASVNSTLPPIRVGKDKDGKPKFLSPSAWLDKNRHAEQISWVPGGAEEIKDQVVSMGGWLRKPGCTILNLYRPPTLKPKAGDVTPWLDHVRLLFEAEMNHIIRWLAHRVQRPGEKINHNLVFGGPQGIGKDTILEPVKRAVGHWNVHEVAPRDILGQFNAFAKSVILRVNEARDLGGDTPAGHGVDRFTFYEHMKTYSASPPDVLKVNEKHLREYYVPNVCGIVITTNHKEDGLYLPADDRRHFVACCDLEKEAFDPSYWNRIYSWFDSGGDAFVADYLLGIDLSDFDPKAPPPKTEAFWTIVNSGRSPDNAKIADALDDLGRPDAVTLLSIIDKTEAGFSEWLRDRKNARQIPHRLEECGYVSVRNKAAPSDGLWRIRGARQVVYARKDLSENQRLAAVTELARRGVE